MKFGSRQENDPVWGQIKFSEAGYEFKSDVFKEVFTKNCNSFLLAQTILFTKLSKNFM